VQDEDNLAQGHRAMGNRDYVRALLSVRQPEFLALLQLVEREIDCELASEGRGTRAGAARA
jgi:hypothetical protein